MVNLNSLRPRIDKTQIFFLSVHVVLGSLLSHEISSKKVIENQCEITKIGAKILINHVI